MYQNPLSAQDAAVNAINMQDMQQAQMADEKAMRDMQANQPAAPGAEDYGFGYGDFGGGGGGAGTSAGTGTGDNAGASDGSDGGHWAHGGSVPHMAAGGLGSLADHGGFVGSYAAGGRMLRGPGDGLSDHIPAVIGKDKPARLADGEFVVSADVVSSLGGGSTEAGARKLYAMMDRIRQNAHGTKKQVKKVNDKQVLPA